MARTLQQIQDDIDRCNWLRTHLADLGDVMEQDTVLARLTAERDAVTVRSAA